MKDAQIILNKLLELGVHLNLVDKTLKVKADKSVMTEDVIAIIKQNAEQLKQFLRTNAVHTTTDNGLIAVSRAQSHYSVSYSQRNILATEFAQGNNEENLIKSAFNVKGELDLEVLSKTLDGLVARHEILRTTYLVTDEGFKQQPQLKMPSSIDVVNASHDVAEQIEFIRSKLASLTIDITRECSMKVMVFKLDSQEYILVFAIHHIAMDGEGLGLLANEFMSLYQTTQDKSESNLVDLDVHYLDYVHWLLAQDSYESDLAYWHGELEAVSRTSTFQHDNLVDAKHGSKKYTSIINNCELSEIERSASRYELTNFMYLQGIFSFLLSKHSQQSTVTIGTPASGRATLATDKMFGNFVNTLVLKTNTENGTLSNYFEQVQQANINALQHQNVPFSDIVTALNAHAQDGNFPWIQVVFKSLLTPEQKIQLNGLLLEHIELAEDSLSVELDVALSFTEQGIYVYWTYDCSLFSEASIALFAEQFKEAIADFNIAHEQTNINDIVYPISQSVDSDHNIIPSDALLHHGFERIADKYPEKIAIQQNDETINFESLNKGANRLAHFLIKQGVTTGDVIAVSLEKSIGSVASMLAVLKAGAVILPLDNKLPIDRAQHMLDSARVAFLVTSESNPFIRLFEDKRVLLTDNDLAVKTINAYSESNPNVAVSSSNALAYIIFTSGSTGKPKGVMVEHKSIVDQNLTEINDYQLGINDRLLHLISFSFDPGFAHLFACLNSGATCYLSEPNRDVVAQLSQSEITHACFPASVLAAIEPVNLPHLRLVTSGAEKCPKHVAKKWSEGRKFFYTYGPTEATVIATYVEYQEELSPAIIGKPTKGTELFVLGANFEPVIRGAVGELFIAGNGLAKGYINAPALTDERFLTLKLCGNKRVYRTGDLVRMLPDGNFEFIGRIDDQIKVNGYRVELGDIETALNNLSCVENAAVNFYKLESKQFLTAYVTPGAEHKFQELWPSVSEYNVLDDVMYRSMVDNNDRVQAYQNAFNAHLHNKTVLEVGPGSTLVLTKLAIAAGAKHVYAIEIDQTAYQQALKELSNYKFRDKVTLILGDASQYELPEKVDYCISSIIGSIASAQGAEQILRPVKKHLKDSSKMIPERSVNYISGIDLSNVKFGFSETSAFYVEKIFDAVGKKFDPRLCLKHVDTSRIITEQAIFDDLDFTQDLSVKPERQFKLSTVKRGAVTGFVISLQLYADKNHFIDNLIHDKGLLPVYIPLNDDALFLNEGDVIEGTILKKPIEGTFKTDYMIEFSIIQEGQTVYSSEIEFQQQSTNYCSNSLYQSLFRNDGVLKLDSDAFSKSILADLSKALPSYMVPAQVVVLPKMPLTNNGKIDRSLLPMPLNNVIVNQGGDANTDMQFNLLKLWQKLLENSEQTIKLNTDFFDIGGHSLLLIKMKLEIAKLFDVELEVKDIFENLKLGQLAELIDSRILKAQLNEFDNEEVLSEGTL